MKSIDETFEEARLAALGQFWHQYPVPDLDFDDLTHLASKITDNPMAALTFVDRDHVWFRSQIGLDLDAVPRDASFCDYVISKSDLFEVENALQDPRFSRHSAVLQKEGIRHYAGVPIFSHDGYPVGTLCVMGPRSKKLDDMQVALLKNLGSQASDRVQLHQVCRSVARHHHFERSILAIAPAGIVVTDPIGNVTHFNNAAEQMLGYSADEVVQKLNYSDFQLDPLNLDEFGLRKGLDENGSGSTASTCIGKNIPQSNIVHRECTCRTKSGHLMDVNLSSSVIYDEHYTPAGWLHVIKDLREARKTETEIRESEARLRDLFHHTSDLIQVVDAQGRILFTNRSWRKTLGYTGEEAKRMHMFDLIHPDLHGHCQQVFESLMGGKDVGLVEVKFVTKDGRAVDVEGDLSVRVENGVPVSTRGIFHDVTSRKKIEAFQKEQTRLLQFRATTAKVIAESEDLALSLRTCAEIIAKHFTAALAGIWTMSDQDHGLELQACAGNSQLCCQFDKQNAMEFKPIGRLAQDRLPILVNNLLDDPGIARDGWIQNERITGFAGLPLVAENKLVGVMAVFSRNELQQDALATLSSVSNGLSLSIQSHKKKKALKQSEARHRMLIYNSKDAMVTLQLPNWKFHSSNPAALDLFGIASEDVFCQLGLWDVSPEQQPCGGASLELSISHIREALETGVSYFEWTHQRLDGSCFPATVLLSRMEQSGEPFLLATIRDITQQKNTEAELLETNRQLIKANKAKSEFLSRMSHELRTPLNGILGFSKLLEMDSLTDRQMRNASRIHQSGQHLLDLINEVLDLSRIEADRLTLQMERVDLTALIHDVVDMIDPMARERKIHVQIIFEEDQPKYVLADRQRLFQVILNLASNGVKYNRVGEKLTFEIPPNVSDRIELRVHDRGPGIGEESYEKVFEPFERLNPCCDEKPVEGTGLGMALSKKLIEAMHGTIRLESQLGRGSVFIVDLPKFIAPSSQKEQKLSEPSQIEPLTKPLSSNVCAPPAMKVLYIEDNIDNFKLVEQVIQLRDHIELTSASNGRMGLEMVEKVAPDLIFLDYHLPELNGDDILTQVKSNPATADIPIYILSADAMPAQIERLKNLGAVDYITKPLDIQHFLSILDSETEMKRAAT